MGFFDWLSEGLGLQKKRKRTIKIYGVHGPEAGSGEAQPRRSVQTAPRRPSQPRSKQQKIVIHRVNLPNREITHTGGNVQIKNWGPPKVCPFCRTPGRIVKDERKPNGWRCMECDQEIT